MRKITVGEWVRLLGGDDRIGVAWLKLAGWVVLLVAVGSFAVWINVQLIRWAAR